MSITEQGIFIKCDLDGYIKEIYFNNISALINTFLNKLFFEIINKDNLKKAFDFFVEIKKNSASFNWLLSLNEKINFSKIYFSGALVNNDIMILASELQPNFSMFLTEMMNIQNDQLNRIRSLEKEKFIIEENKNSNNSQLFEKISSLNNELVDLQRELVKKNKELNELNEQKNKLLGMAAHDLRIPLHNIMIYVEFLKSDFSINSTGEQIEFLDTIYEQASFMHNLINELLNVSNIDFGKVIVHYEKVNLIAFLEKIVTLAKNISNKKNIKINLEHDLKTSEVYLDSSKINQVLTNLLTNAIKFSFNNSVINLKVVEQNENLFFTVEDNGQGISQEDLPNIFMPFKTTKTKSTAGEKSTGLGLYIVKRIIEAHKGKIWVESKINLGTSFYFTIPKILTEL